MHEVTWFCDYCGCLMVVVLNDKTSVPPDPCYCDAACLKAQRRHAAGVKEAETFNDMILEAQDGYDEDDFFGE